MRILAVDTSTDVCSVCVTDDQRVVAEHVSQSGVTHTERLMPAIDFVFSSLGWGIDQLNGLAVIHGPGSFTGLRISLSVVKGLSYALKIPVVVGNALEVAAHQVPLDGLICPMMDARRGEIFTCLFERTAQALIQRTEPKSVRPEQWNKDLPAGSIHFCGPGVPVYFSALGEESHDVVFTDFVLARTLAALAERKLQAGDAISGSEVKAAYLRPSDAEVRGPRPRKIFTR